jgi:hypothetical protein
MNTCVRPCRPALRSLNKVPYHNLDPEFKTQVASLRTNLLAATAAKGSGSAVSGSGGGKGGGWAWQILLATS